MVRSNAKNAGPKKPRGGRKPAPKPRVEKIHWLVFGQAREPSQAGFQTVVPQSMIKKHLRKVNAVTTLSFPRDLVPGVKDSAPEQGSKDEEKDQFVNYTVTLIKKGGTAVTKNYMKCISEFSGRSYLFLKKFVLHFR